MVQPTEIHKNMSLRRALRVAEELGCTVRVLDEFVIKHPSWPAACRVNHARHDATQVLVSRLRRLALTQAS